MFTISITKAFLIDFFLQMKYFFLTDARAKRESDVRIEYSHDSEEGFFFSIDFIYSWEIFASKSH